MPATMARRPASANGKLRLEPTALPTRIFRLGDTAFGWHPLIVPVAHG